MTLATFLKKLIPTDFGRRLLCVLALVFNILVFLNQLDTRLNFGNKLDDGLGAVAFAPLVVILLILLLIFGLVVLASAFGKRGHPAPLVILAVGFALAIIAPLPPAPPLIEEQNLATYHSQYDELLALVKANNLTHDDNCKAASSFVVPSEYRQLSKECIHVSGNGSMVEFSVRSFYRPLVYVSNPINLKGRTSPCDGDGIIYKKIDEHWYICNRNSL